MENSADSSMLNGFLQATTCPFAPSMKPDPQVRDGSTIYAFPPSPKGGPAWVSPYFYQRWIQKAIAWRSILFFNFEILESCLNYKYLSQLNFTHNLFSSMFLRVIDLVQTVYRGLWCNEGRDGFWHAWTHSIFFHVCEPVSIMMDLWRMRHSVHFESKPSR